MPVRKFLLVGLVLALPACTWLPWYHRSVRGTTAPTVPVTSPAPARAPPVRPPSLAVGVLPVAPSVVQAHPVRPPSPRSPVTSRPMAASSSVSQGSGVLEIRGQVRLVAGPGQQLHPGELADTVVYFMPAQGAPAPRPRHAEVVTNHRDFIPTALVVPQGSTVTYVNRDKVRHNVFSVTPGAEFNLGYQPAGTQDPHVFGKAGLVLVNCNVHHSMEMDILVVPSPYATRVGGDGRFVLHHVPAGMGTLVAWNPRARLLRQRVALPRSNPLVVSLIAERPRVVTRVEVGP